ncbi:MAG: MIP/aquaporin family protein [Chitinophagaceae bacterium]
MRQYITEFIGTFFLLAGAAFGGAIGAALALMVMIYAGGHISGAHYNPAVTAAMYMRGKTPKSELPGYFIAQFLGAAVAALLIKYLFDTSGVAGCDGFGEGIIKALFAEFLGTFALAYVVLNVATAKGTAGNSYFGLAIAATVLGMAFLFGRFSGGVFNPAVGVGLAVQGSVCWQQLWLFFVAPLAGGILGAAVFKIVNEDDEEMEIPEEPHLKIEDNAVH